MDIPIKILFKGNGAELERDLFGLGDVVTDPEILKILGNKDEPPRYVNKTAQIAEGVIIGPPKIKQFRKAMESLETGFVDYNYIISLIDVGLGIGTNVFTITNWLLNKLQKHDCKILIDNKEVKTREEFQKTLDGFIQDNIK